MAKNLLPFILIIMITVGVPPMARAEGDYEFYFFGVNLKSLKNSNWLHVAAGAAASLLAHELGHALYLETQGEKWDYELSFPSGMAVTFSDVLSQNQYRDFGRAGFALQTGIGLLLASMPATSDSDFTKGWAGISSVQVLTYDVRAHEHGNDFSMIEKGGGDPDLEMGIAAVISSYSLLLTETAKGGHWLASEGLKYLQQEPSFEAAALGDMDSLKFRHSF